MTKTVTERSNDNGTRSEASESVADILERELDGVIHDWMRLVEKQEDLMSIALSYEDRTGHLPALLREEWTVRRIEQAILRLRRCWKFFTAAKMNKSTRLVPLSRNSIANNGVNGASLCLRVLPTFGREAPCSSTWR